MISFFLSLTLAFIEPAPPAQAAAFIAPEAGSSAKDLQRVIRQTGEESVAAPPGMVHIPGGETQIGIDIDMVEELAGRDIIAMTNLMAQTPFHVQLIDAFFIDVTEVSNLQWKTFLIATGRKPSEALVEYGWPGGEIPEGQEQFPIPNVNYPEIRDYLEWSGKRLPTEFEWARASRGDDNRLWPWGDRFDPRACQSGLTIPQTPVTVGTHPLGASPYAVMNLAGNVSEWTSSPFKQFDDYQPLRQKVGRKTQTITPQFNSAQKVVKGGHFGATRMLTRIDFRGGINTMDSDAALGFRASRTMTPCGDVLATAFQRLGSPQFASSELDYVGMFGREITTFDVADQVIIEYRHLAFGTRGQKKGSRLSSLRRSGVDEPVALGVLTSSEPIVMTDMPTKTMSRGEMAIEVPYILPPGDYALCWKGEGESKAYKERMKKERRSGSSQSKKDEESTDEAESKPPDVPNLGAAAPWPGVVDHINQDIDFPQDQDIFLYYNANNAVVAWQKTGDINETEARPISATESNAGRLWTLDFVLNNTASKVPHFVLPIQLDGEGL